MRKNLSFMMLALLPFASFGQKSKVSTHPVKQRTLTPVMAAAQLSNKAPTAYCTPVLNCTDGDLITNVKFAGIDNTTTCSENGFGDFTAMTTTTELLAGNSYPISVTVYDGSWPHENVSAWVDFNQNETFDTDEYFYIGNRNTGSTTVTANIAIPEGIANGNYRMRVRVAADGNNANDNTTACNESQAYGETEDYTIIIGANTPTGCLAATNGQWPTANFTPSCTGVVQNITSAAYLNEFSKVNLTAGTAYTFSTSDASYFLTIGDEAGETVLASGTGSVSYTPTADSVVRFYSHLSSSCDGSNTIHKRMVMCGTPPPAPEACADFKVLSNNIENGGFLGGEQSQKLAIDLPIGSSAFTLYGFEPTVAGTATSFNFIFYDDNAGLPGAQIGTRTGTIAGSTVTGTNFGYDFIKYTVTFDSPIDFAANTRYWVEMTSDAVAWESTTASGLGSKDAFMNTGTSGAWTIGTTDYVFNPICTNLAVNEPGNKRISFYPNPVKDVLTINSKNKIITVHVYNVAGQKMPVSSKFENGKIDMSKFAPGLYIISTIDENGKNQSFKILKK